LYGSFDTLPLSFFRVDWLNARGRAADLQAAATRCFLRTDVRWNADRRIGIGADRDRPRRSHGNNWLLRGRREFFLLHHIRCRRCTGTTCGWAWRGVAMICAGWTGELTTY